MRQLSVKSKWNAKDPWRWAGMAFLAVGIGLLYVTQGTQDCNAIQTQWFTGSVPGALVTIGAMLVLLPLLADLLSIWRGQQK